MSQQDRNRLKVAGVIVGVLGIARGLEGGFQPAGCHLSRPHDDDAHSTPPAPMPPRSENQPAPLLIPVGFRVTDDLHAASSGGSRGPV